MVKLEVQAVLFSFASDSIRVGFVGFLDNKGMISAYCRCIEQYLEIVNEQFLDLLGVKAFGLEEWVTFVPYGWNKRFLVWLGLKGFTFTKKLK